MKNRTFGWKGIRNEDYFISGEEDEMEQEAETLTTPVFMENTKELMCWMQKLTYEKAKKLWACNDKIAELNYERFRNMDLTCNLTPAILSYEGIAYQYMAPSVFEDGEFDYVQENLRIFRFRLHFQTVRRHTVQRLHHTIKCRQDP